VRSSQRVTESCFYVCRIVEEGDDHTGVKKLFEIFEPVMVENEREKKKYL